MANLRLAVLDPSTEQTFTLLTQPQSSELWLDVKIHTVGPDFPVAKELLREEHTKCKACGQKDGYSLQALDKGMTPVTVVLEQLAELLPGHRPYSTGLFITDYKSLSDKACPSPTLKRSPAPSCGPDFQYFVQSSMAGSCGVYFQNRPGRPWRHSTQPAKLPLGVPVSEPHEPPRARFPA